MNQGKYGPDLLTDFICDFMEDNVDDPFFVYYPMVLVHDPFVPTPETVGEQPITHGRTEHQKDMGRRRKFLLRWFRTWIANRTLKEN